MEFLVKVEKVTSCRPLICDTCGEPLVDIEKEEGKETYSFFAQFWKEDPLFSKGRLYLEKFICSNCLKLFPDAVRYDFATAPKEMVELIQSQLERDDYGHFLVLDSFKEVEKFLQNPSLFRLLGKKIK